MAGQSPAVCSGARTLGCFPSTASGKRKSWLSSLRLSVAAEGTLERTRHRREGQEEGQGSTFRHCDTHIPQHPTYQRFTPGTQLNTLKCNVGKHSRDSGAAGLQVPQQLSHPGWLWNWIW